MEPVSLITCGHKRDETHFDQLMGEGDIDFVWIVEQLEAAGYEGDCSLEYELHDPGPATGLGIFLQQVCGDV